MNANIIGRGISFGFIVWILHIFFLKRDDTISLYILLDKKQIIIALLFWLTYYDRFEKLTCVE